MKTAFLLGFILPYALAITFFRKVEFSNKTGALCLDGSPGGLYTYEPEDTSKTPNKLLIMLEWAPNGWCFKKDLNSSLAGCSRWRTEPYGSSKDWANDFMDLYGILAINAPGEFAHWRKVLIKSCDGGSYLGNTMIDHRGQRIYFRGSRIMEEAINYLNHKGWLKNRQ